MRRWWVAGLGIGLAACGGEQVVTEVAPKPSATAQASAPLPTAAPSATPAAPDPLEEKVRRMALVKRSFSPSFSPDGQRIAFVSDSGALPELYTMPADGGKAERVTALSDPVNGVQWSPDGAWLAFIVAPGGGMNRQVHLVRPDGKEARRITDGGKENNWLGLWSRDSKVLTVSSNRRDAAAIDSYFFDPAAQKLDLIIKNPGMGHFIDVTRDHKMALLSRMVNRGNNDVYLVDAEKKSETRLTPHEGPGTFWGYFSKDGKAVYLASNKDRDTIAFAKIKLGAGNKPGPIEVVVGRDDAELASFALDDQGTKAALLWNVAGQSELAFVDLATGKSTPGPKLPRELASGIEYSRDGKRLVMVMSGPAAPTDIWLFDVATGTFKQVTQSPHEGVVLDELVRPELVRFTAPDGVQLSGWLYRPREAKGASPFVLSYHGGPEGQEVPVFRSDYQALLAMGIGVFAPNIRGSSGFGKKFVNLDNGALRVNAVKDIRACVDYLVSKGIGDAKRLGIMGGSYGGYMVMAGVTEYPELFAAGANLYGIVNFATFFKHTEPWMAAISKIEYGDPDKEGEMLRSLSPLHKLDKVSAAVIVLHGKNDTNVPVVEAEQVVQTLKNRGVPVEYVLFQDEGHGFQKAENRIRSTVSLSRWFEKYLKAPAKTGN